MDNTMCLQMCDLKWTTRSDLGMVCRIEADRIRPSIYLIAYFGTNSKRLLSSLSIKFPRSPIPMGAWCEFCTSTRMIMNYYLTEFPVSVVCAYSRNGILIVKRDPKQCMIMWPLCGMLHWLSIFRVSHVSQFYKYEPSFWDQHKLPRGCWFSPKGTEALSSAKTIPIEHFPNPFRSLIWPAAWNVK